VFREHVNLLRGLEREHVPFRDHDYTLRGSESRALASVGAFRVVPLGRHPNPATDRHLETGHSG
jgi:hypothetical protein